MTSTSPTEPAAPRWYATVLWWAVTLATLVVLDDFTFGPGFWLLSYFGSPLLGFLAAMAVYVPMQVFIVGRGMADEPGRVASFFLSRLDLQRRSAAIGDRERQLKSRVTGALSAVALSLVIGGVIPPLLLWRQGYERTFVRRISFVTATVYATEFAALHGALPGLL